MLTPVQQEWANALRSGSYTQGQGSLHTKSGEMCCLGVACDMYRESHKLERALEPADNGIPERWAYGAGMDYSALYPPAKVAEWLGLRTRDGEYETEDGYTSLAEKNDGGASFEEIADIIEEYQESLFEELKG